MNNKLILLTGYKHFFGQTRKPWVSVDTPLLIDSIREKGIDVAEFSFDQIANTEELLTGSIIFYTFSQKENFRLYLKSVIHHLHSAGNRVIPDYNLLLCHENKGYQELYKKQLGIDSLQAYFFSSIKSMNGYEIKYPVVLKTVYGTNANGVFLIHSQKELETRITKLQDRQGILQKIDLIRRRFFRRKKHFRGYPGFDSFKDYIDYKEYISPEMRFLLQEFIPGLEFDYRLIILGNRYFTMKRINRDDDFRASGSKRFITNESIPQSLLDYGKRIFESFNTPFLSLDIGMKDEQYFLFEFQALHFGISSILLSDGYYRQKQGEWVYVKEKLPFETVMADGLHSYLTAKGHIAHR